MKCRLVPIASSCTSTLLASKAALGTDAALALALGDGLGASPRLGCAPSQPMLPARTPKMPSIRQKCASRRPFRTLVMIAKYAYHAPYEKGDAAMIDRQQLDRSVDSVAPQVIELSKQIHAHPELRFEEHRAASWLADTVEGAGISVERGVGDLPTAFRARLGNGPGPRIAILAEYDALPEIGHACGHNLIAGGALGAFLALAKQAKLPGNVDLIGT